jgi:two-component system cell cycle response regulator CpdR
LVCEFLESKGFAVESVPDAEAAIRALECTGSSFDLVITDMAMPGKRKGDAVARKARELGVPVIILSGCGHVAEDVPHDRLVSKPFSFGDLLQAVNGVLSAP